MLTNTYKNKLFFLEKRRSFMSKKMMKRSLALGALMAFVITGSAMAAENELTSGSEAITAGGNYTVNGNVVLDGSTDKDEIMIGSASRHPIAEDKKIAINLNNGAVLNVTSNNDEPGSDVYGVIANTEIIGDLNGNTSVILNAISTKNENVAGLGTGSVDKIQASNIEIHSAGNNAIYDTSTDGTFTNSHTLIGNTVLLESKGRTIYSHAGMTDITAGKLTIVSDRSHEGKENNAITLRDNGTVNIKADEANFTGGIDISSTGNAVLNLNDKSGEGEIKNFQITGNIKANSGTINGLTFAGEDSFIKGNVNTEGNENAKLTLKNKGSWINQGVSKVEDLTLAGGVVDYTAKDADGKIEVGTLSGKGDIKVSDADKTVMTVGAAGEGKELKATTSNQDVELEDLTNVAKWAETGTTAIDVVEKTGGTIYSSESAEVDEDGKLGKVNKVVDAANYSVSDMAAIGLISWRAEMNDMNKRLGELRNANGEHGVWVRMVRGEDSYKSVTHQYNQYQLGFDQKLSADSSWTVGAALSYTDGESSFAKGNGENTNKAISVYGSKLNKDGSFIDVIAKYARLENEFNVTSGMGGGEYDTNGYSVSAEVGKRFQQGSGLWIEPQAELSYGKVSSVDYMTKKGLKVNQDGMESLVGRLGFSLGQDVKGGNVYARASYLYDFDGETEVTLGGQQKLEQDLGGGWWEVGVGTNINLSKAAYIYADVEKTFGGEVDTDWQWNLGVRYSF